MIAVDTNILVYAHRRDSEFFARAYESVASLAAGPAQWAIPWPCIHEFIAISTHPRIYDPPSDLAEAIDQVDAWFESPTLVVLGESPTHWNELSRLLTKGSVRGPRVHDARIAAICLAHGVTVLWSADRDFGRFTDLVTHNPLV